MSLAGLKQNYSSKRFHPVLVTEVTRMQGGAFCVAGWDLHRERIVRPQPPAGHNWELHRGRVPFAPGQIVDCKQGHPPGGLRIPPHCNEDFFLAARPQLLAQLAESELHSALLDTLDRNIRDIFGLDLIERRYLEEGTGRRSLGGIVLHRSDLFFFHNENRLRFHLIDADRHAYDLPVTDNKLLRYFSPDPEKPGHHLSEKDANEWLELNDPAAPIILRIGMARGWAGNDKTWIPKRCYAQLNGIICPTDNWPALDSRRLP